MSMTELLTVPKEESNIEMHTIHKVKTQTDISEEMLKQSAMLAETRAKAEAEVAKMQLGYHRFYMNALQEHHLDGDVCRKDNPSSIGRLRLDCTFDDSGVPLIRIMYKANYSLTAYPAIHANPLIWKHPVNIIRELIDNYEPVKPV
jgi:hypothetical protein